MEKDNIRKLKYYRFYTTYQYLKVYHIVEKREIAFGVSEINHKVDNLKDMVSVLEDLICGKEK